MKDKIVTAEARSAYSPAPGPLGFIEEIYLTVFTLFYKVGSSDWPEATNRSKGAVGVTIMAISLILGTLDFVCTLAGRPIILIPKWTACLFGFVLWLLNFYVLVIRRHGLKFESEFDNLSKLKRSALRVVAIVVFVGSLVFVVYSVPNKRKDSRQEHKRNESS